MIKDINQKENTPLAEQSKNTESSENETPETLIEETQSFISKTTDETLKESQSMLLQFGDSSKIRNIITGSNSEIIEVSQNTNEEIENLKTQKNNEGIEKIPKDFEEAIKVLLEELNKIEKSVEGGYVTTYGSFIEKTSRENDILVDTLGWYDKAPAGFGEAPGGEMRQRLVLIARDITNKIIGLRLSNLKSISGNHCCLEASGEIITKVRGRGFSTAIDKVFEKVLTMVANERKQAFLGSDFNIKWKIENANLGRLKDGIKSNKFNELELKIKEEEQKRWQSVYGDNGKLGFKKESDKENDYLYSKIIKPTINDDAPRYETERKKSQLINHSDFLIKKPVDMPTFQNIKESLKNV